MKFRRTFFALLFAVAAILGGALSGASAAESADGAGFGLAATVGCAVSDGTAKAPSFHPCGKMRNGMAIQCHVDEGILPVDLTGAPDGIRPAYTLAPARGHFTGVNKSVFRPPRAI